MMKKIRSITVHGAHNYGACLQAYGLQEYCKILDPTCDFKVINFRDWDKQKVYDLLHDFRNTNSIILSILLHLYKKDMIKKSQLFEKFIKEDLNLTKEFNPKEQIECEDAYTYYICGSDQIWNTDLFEFDWNFLLEFVKNGRKISYAASMGGSKENWNSNVKNRLQKDLNDFDYISVREEGTKEKVLSLVNKSISINIDPTLLLHKKHYDRLIDGLKSINKEYIFLYALYPTKTIVEFAQKMSSLMGIPVVISQVAGRYDYFSKFEKHLDTGPKEFLNYIKNAKLVITTSFHGTVFSILYNKEFVTLNGDTDLRIKNLLKLTGLEGNVANIDNIADKLVDILNTDFSYANLALDEERKKSERFLKEALDL